MFEKQQIIILIILVQIVLMPVEILLQNSPQPDIIVISDTAITAINPSNHTPTPIHIFETPISPNTIPYQVIDADYDVENHLLYVVRGQLPDLDTTPRITLVEKINIVTGEKSIVYEKRVVVDLTLSPDKTRAILKYYDGEVVWLGETHLCILEIEKGICETVDFKADDGRNNIWWLDEQTFMSFSWSPRSLYTIDALTLDVRVMPGLEAWQVHTSALIPQTRSLLLSVSSHEPDNEIRSPRLIIYDLDTAKTKEYPLSLTSPDYLQPYMLSFAPSGNYFIIGGFQALSIVAFGTATPVTELKSVTQTSWSSDGSHILAAVNTTLDKLQVLNINLHTNITREVSIDPSGSVFFIAG
jgi:hypothetical protein